MILNKLLDCVNKILNAQGNTDIYRNIPSDLAWEKQH